MAVADLQLQRILAVAQQPPQFEHRLAWQNHLDIAACARLLLGIAQRQAVAVGGHRADPVTGHLQQQAVEVVAHVLVGHGEGGLVDQPLEHPFGKAQPFAGRRGLDAGIVLRRQGAHGETAAAGAQGRLVALDVQGDVRTLRQRLADVHQLARRQGELQLSVHLRGGAGGQFHLQVGGGEPDRARGRGDQHIGQDGQSLAAFHHAARFQQGTEQLFPVGLDLHGRALR